MGKFLIILLNIIILPLRGVVYVEDRIWEFCSRNQPFINWIGKDYIESVEEQLGLELDVENVECLEDFFKESWLGDGSLYLVFSLSESIEPQLLEKNEGEKEIWRKIDKEDETYIDAISSFAGERDFPYPYTENIGEVENGYYFGYGPYWYHIAVYDIDEMKLYYYEFTI